MLGSAPLERRPRRPERRSRCGRACCASSALTRTDSGTARRGAAQRKQDRTGLERRTSEKLIESRETMDVVEKHGRSGATGFCGAFATQRNGSSYNYRTHCFHVIGDESSAGSRCIRPQFTCDPAIPLNLLDPGYFWRGLPVSAKHSLSALRVSY